MFEKIKEDRLYKEFSEIYNISEKLKLSLEETRLLTYIHTKITENKDQDYFNKNNDTEILALQIILGKKNLHESNISSQIEKLDFDIMCQYNIENRVSKELNNRLKLHSDTFYKEKMLAIYFENILPNLQVTIG